MTMLTSTIAWCTPCVERARRAHSSTLDVISHLFGSSSESFHNHLHTIHGAPSLTRFSLSTSTCSSLSFFPSTSSTPSCTLSSTTRSSWKACATPPSRRVRTPTTSPLPSQRTTVIEPWKHSLSAYEISKKVSHLLRHSQQVHREENGAVHFWRIKENLQNQFPQSIHWSDDRWKVCLAAGGGAKKEISVLHWWFRNNYYFRARQGHSGRNLIDPSLQDNVVIPSGLFQHIYHVGCAFNLHSIINSGLILGGQNSSKGQTVFFLPIDPNDKSQKDPDEIDLNVPRHAQYLHNAWKRDQDAVYWVDIDLAILKGLTFYQTRSNAIFKKHFQLIVFQKLLDWKLEKSYTKK